MSERLVRFAVRLNDNEHDRIAQLARAMNTTRTQAIRQLALNECDRRGITSEKE